MKIFQSMLKYYRICGIIIQPQPNSRLNIRFVAILLFIFLLFVSLVKEFLFKLSRLEEYIDKFCLIITVIAALMNYLECFWKRVKMSEFIEKWEELIEKSNFLSKNLTFFQFL